MARRRSRSTIPAELLRIDPADWLPQGDLEVWDWWIEARGMWDDAWMQYLADHGWREDLRQLWLSVDRAECDKHSEAPWDESAI